MAFAAGTILGPVRELVLAPRIGRDAALLVEAPLMLAVIVLAARFVVRRLAVPPATGQRLRMGLSALALLLATELTLGVTLRGLGIAQQVAGWASLFGAVTWLLYLALATTPALVAQERG